MPMSLTDTNAAHAHIEATVRALPGVRASDTIQYIEHAAHLINIRKESCGMYQITGPKGGSIRYGYIFNDGRASRPINF